MSTKKMLVKAGLTGAINAIAGTYYFGNGSVNMFNFDLPVYVPLAISGAGASLATDLLQDKVLSMIPLNEDWVNIEGAIVGAGISGLANYGILALSVGIPQRNIIPSVLIGAGSYVAGDYGANRLLSVNHGELIF